jgi:hypothetical protein
MFIMLGTRPDVCFAVGYLSRFQDKASDTHFYHLMRVLKYLKTSSSLKLHFVRSSGVDRLVGYADADWANDMLDRKSTSGYCFRVFNSLVSWSSKKQSLVSLSTVEAEYVSLSEAAAECLWLVKILKSLLVNVTDIVIFEDNVNCINLAKDSRNSSKRTKHIDIKYYFVKDLVSKKFFRLEYICTNKQVADMFTKPLSAGQLCIFRNNVGLS